MSRNGAAMFSACINRWSKAAMCRGHLLVKDVPKKYHKDLDYLVEQLDWEGNVDPAFKDNHYLEPISAAGGRRQRLRGPVDCLWQGRRRAAVHRQGTDRRSRREITIKDNGAYGLIAVQGCGTINGKRLQTPAMIRFHALTEDEYFVSHGAAQAGMTFENTGDEPLVVLRYFGPDTNPDAPGIGDAK